MNFGALWPFLERHPKRFDGPFAVTRLSQSDAKVIVCFRIVGFAGDRFTQRYDGIIDLFRSQTIDPIDCIQRSVLSFSFRLPEGIRFPELPGSLLTAAALLQRP